jgi:tRNA-splicing ligase RtcB (3'-phosphate/5'-hydroxy nucleic acid ligase)
LAQLPLSHRSLDAIARDEGSVQLGTLGGGNHFVEFQADEEGRLWLMIHSGSRAMGQAIRGHHLARATRVGSNLHAVDATEAAGQAYANDVDWARAYAAANRQAIAERVAGVAGRILSAPMDWAKTIAVDHNHVARERIGDAELWVHRKGAMPAPPNSPGVVPGSMGTPSYHVIGLGRAEALHSSAHGAGRSMSRESARRSVTERAFHREMTGVWYDYRQAAHLREESPSAYKDVRAVMRAQRDLVKITRTLRPILNYKGT